MYKKLKDRVKGAQNRPNFHHFWCDINFSDPPIETNMNCTFIKLYFWVPDKILGKLDRKRINNGQNF